MYYRRYGQYLRDLFGAKVYKVSVDAGFTCPTLDGTKSRGGCTYCNNASFRPQSVNRRLELRPQVERGIAAQRARFGAEAFIVYFQNYTNTYGDPAELAELYDIALSVPGVVGLSISTRPDAVPEPILAVLAELAERTLLWVEYGLESSHDATLTRIARGHDYACFEDAVRRTALFPKINIAAHAILGLPGEDRGMMLETIDRISALPISGIKLHHLHVVDGTILAREYRSAPFPLFTLEEYADLLCEALERLREDIVVLRLLGESAEALLIGPHWGYNKTTTLGRIERVFKARNIRQGARCTPAPASPALFSV